MPERRIMYMRQHLREINFKAVPDLLTDYIVSKVDVYKSDIIGSSSNHLGKLDAFRASMARWYVVVQLGSEMVVQT